MTNSKIILPDAKREIKPPELKEGITPPEYMGEDIDLPEFDESRQYGLWCMKDSPHVEKMLAIFQVFIPITHHGEAQIIEPELREGGAADPLAQRYTTGWKYKPVYQDNMSGEKVDRPNMAQSHNF